MKKLFVVTKNELLRYFVSPLAYVYLVTFLVLNGSFAVYFGHFVERGIADLSPMFAFHPWLYLLFIPGIAMRLWSEEFRNKTVVQIVTMPVGINTLVWGKFLASWIFVLVALVLTFPFIITVNYLGTPDNKVILVSYLGSLILSGCMLAISQTMSALTKNQVVALVLSVVANFLFFLSGVEYVLGFFRMFAPAVIVDTVASFSFLTHFGQVVRGLLEGRFLVFATSIIILFNALSVMIVSFKTSGTSRWLKSTQSSYYTMVAVLLLLAFAGLNMLSNRFLRTWQYDFTEEKIYTLTPSSKAVLSSIPEKITAKLYYSPILGQRNPEIRDMYDKIRLLLQRFQNLEPDKFSYRIYNPEPLTAEEDAAIADKLQPIPMIDISQNGFMGLVFADAADNKQVISYFPTERRSFLEQDLIEKIYELLHKKKTVGLISGLPIFETGQDYGYVSPQWHIVDEIRRFYNVIVIKSPDDLPKVDVLMLVHPQKLSAEMVNEIKRYSQHGGKALVLMDTAAEAQRIFSSRNIEFSPSDLSGLEKFWGFRMFDEMVVVDLENSITVDATKNYSTNPIFTQDVVQFALPNNCMNPDFKVTRNLQSILFASASLLVPDGYNSEFIPLIVGGKNSGVMSSNVVYDGTSPDVLLGRFKPINKLKVLAALLKSKNKKFPFEVIVVADTDFAYDSFWSKSITLLENNYFIPLYDNANFILNSLDYLSGDEALIDLRGHSPKSRIFEDLESRRKQNLLDFQIKEHEIFDKIYQTKESLNEITAKRNFEERDNFTPDELALIAGTRQKLQSLVDDLRFIRQNMHDDVNRSAFAIKLLNIAAVPLLILAVLLMRALLKHKGERGCRFRLTINREFKIVSGITLLAMSAGLISVYYANRGDWSNFENKKVFADLDSNLAKVDKVVLSQQDKVLSFEDVDGEWVLNGEPCLAVYQERIRRLLTTIAQMTYYEKKSNRIENLSAFGLMTSDNKETEGVKVQLFTGNEVNAEFYLGKYDIDIGRGGRAAYIRFKNEFQVWMVRADFIDMTLNETAWTYGSLWNLRFGRLMSFNDNTNLNRTLTMTKDLLGTEFEERYVGKPKGSKIMDLKVFAENDVRVGIEFFKHDGNIYVKYGNIENSGDGHLQRFEKVVQKCYYKIGAKQFEEINNVVKTSKKRER